MSGFGLKVTADSGASFTDIDDYNVGECTASVQGFGIFPGTIDVNELTGLVDNNGTPIAPSWDPCSHAGPTGLNTNALILEMGALYVEGNEPALSGTLILVKVDSDCNVCVETESIRGNVVLTDGNEAIVIYSPNCVPLLQIEYDYGDANDPTYPTLLASTGARHAAIGPMLGANRDIEADGQPSPNADLDDNTGVPDDEDGITNLVATAVVGSVDVTVTGACFLNAWIDFDNNGSWAGEQIFTNQPLVAGPNTLTFAVPAGAVVETDLISRWRVSTVGSDNYTGDAADGEVEDYNQPRIECHVPDVVGDPCDAAIAEIIANGFTIGNITTEPNDVIALDDVISTDPPYCNYPGCNTAVDLVVSEGSGDPNIGTCWDQVNECRGQYAFDGASAAITGLGGDSDCDGQVNFADLGALMRGWGETYAGSPRLCDLVTPDVYCCCTDWNHDGVINFIDLGILMATWGNTGYSPATLEQSCPP